MMVRSTVNFSAALLLTCGIMFGQLQTPATLLPKPTLPVSFKLQGYSAAIVFKTSFPSGDSREEEIFHHQLDENHWRTDFPSASSAVCDGFWFTVALQNGSYRYDRLGFSDDPIAEGEITPRARGYLVAGSHVMEVELSQFLSDPAIALTPVDGNLLGSKSQFGLQFTATPAEGSDFREAFGRVEWMEVDENSYVTLIHYSGGQPGGEKTTPQMIYEIQYRELKEHLVVQELIFTQGDLTQTAVLTSVEPAPTDFEFYSPEYFGLNTPKRPMSRIMFWAFTSGSLVAATILVGWLRRKRR